MNLEVPSLRARIAQRRFLNLRQFGGDELEARVRSRIDPSALNLIDRAPPTSWLTITDDRPLVDAIVDTLGPEEARAFWCHSVGPGLLKTGLFKVVTEAAVRLKGLNPATFIRLFPRAFDLAFRGCGVPKMIENDAREGFAVAHLEDMPDVLLDAPNYFVSFHGTFEGLVEAAECEGSVAFRCELERRRLVAEINWTPR